MKPLGYDLALAEQRKRDEEMMDDMLRRPGQVIVWRAALWLLRCHYEGLLDWSDAGARDAYDFLVHIGSEWFSQSSELQREAR
jgi:hypothetical protein